MSFLLWGCGSSASDFVLPQSQDGAVTSGLVTLNFTQARPRVLPVPANTVRVRLSGRDAAGNPIQTSAPPLPRVLDFANPLGPIPVPIAVKTLRVEYFDVNNQLLGSGEVPLDLRENQSLSLAVPFDDGTPDVVTAPVNVTFNVEDGQYGHIPVNQNVARVRFTGVNGTTAVTGPNFPATVDLDNPVGPIAVPVSVTTLTAHFLTAGNQTLCSNSVPATLTGGTPITLNIPFLGNGVVFVNENTAGVVSGPVADTVFNMREAWTLDQIYTYHLGASAPPGATVSLRRSDNTVFGPYPVAGGPYFLTGYPLGISLPSGTYTVVDSEPATWSQNGLSAGRGFTRILGSINNNND